MSGRLGHLLYGDQTCYEAFLFWANLSRWVYWRATRMEKCLKLNQIRWTVLTLRSRPTTILSCLPC